jgi:tetratricopeptide (TPR) repeat protein
MRLLVRAFSFITVVAGSAFAQSAEKVIVVTELADLRVGTATVATVTRGQHFTVEKQSGDWLWVNPPFIKGWVHRRDVIAFDRGIEYFSAAIRTLPTVANYICRAWLWQAQEKSAEAMRDFNEAVRVDPSDTFARMARADEFERRGEVDKAIDDCTEAIRLRSSRPGDLTRTTAHWRRGTLWMERREFDGAMADFTEAIRLNPDFASAEYLMRADAWKAKGEYGLAIADYDRYIRRNGNSGLAYSLRGLAWGYCGEYGKAGEDLKIAIRLDAADGLVCSNVAWFLATCRNDNSRDGTKAVEYAKKGCEVTGWDAPFAVSALAAANAEVGNFDDAVKWQQRAIELAMKNRLTASNVGEYRTQLEQYQAHMPHRDVPIARHRDI